MCQAISSTTAARTGWVVCLPSRIWAWRALGEHGPISSAGPLMGLHCHLAKAALPRAWQRTTGFRNGFPRLVCPFLSKGLGGTYSLHSHFYVLSFFSWAVGAVPREKSWYGTVRKNQRRNWGNFTPANLSAHLEGIPNTHWRQAKRRVRGKIWALRQTEDGFEKLRAAEARPVHFVTVTVFTRSLSFLL